MALPSDSLGVVELSITRAAAVVPHNSNRVNAGRQLLINCTTVGDIKVKLSGGSDITIPIDLGITVLPWAVVQVFVTGTTAVATYTNLS